MYRHPIFLQLILDVIFHHRRAKGYLLRNYYLTQGTTDKEAEGISSNFLALAATAVSVDLTFSIDSL